jgi:putative hydrolase of HD superfamily
MIQMLEGCTITMREWLSLKHVLREGWVRAGVDSPESVAAHSWGMSILAMHLCPDDLDKMRVLEMCLVHDLPEVEVGDLTPHDDTSTKSQDEHKAMTKLAPQWLDLFEEYEEQVTEEAKFVKYLDKLDMALMARIYEDSQGLNLSEFIASAREVIGETNLK